ncbi:MAG: DoxX family protein [Gemmatimonadota bacterium]
MWTRLRLLLAWVVGLYLLTVFVPQGWRKFDPEGFWSAPFQRWGYPPWFRVLVGILETGGGIALVVPWLATYGGTALALVMGGAFYTRWGSGYPMDLAWIAAWGAAALWVAYEWRSWRWRPRSPLGTNATTDSTTVG